MLSKPPLRVREQNVLHLLLILGCPSSLIQEAVDFIILDNDCCRSLAVGRSLAESSDFFHKKVYLKVRPHMSDVCMYCPRIGGRRSFTRILVLKKKNKYHHGQQH
jgi:hypothetical protein